MRVCASAIDLSIGIATVSRYIREAVDVWAALAPSLGEAMWTTRQEAYVILDGILPPIDGSPPTPRITHGSTHAEGVELQKVLAGFSAK
ncbi:hypothetical protein ACIREE_27110 [Streptomyces sp. NPDC102467]|uniref:hypothetical protein n=1 Tax=Streptomyces sp. NPDC102467 TaxID=3366179 RepID=UPI003809F18F